MTVEKYKDAALDCLAFGILGVLPDRTIIYANRSATQLLRDSTYIEARSGQLYASDPLDDQKLYALLGARHETFVTKDDDVGQLLRLRGSRHHEGQNREAMLLCVPIDRGSNDASPAGRLLVIGGIDTRPSITVTLLQSSYGLTPSEARIALALIEGHSIQACAEKLNIKPGTARVHLKKVFSKTGCRRQTDLVIELLSNPLLNVAQNS